MTPKEIKRWKQRLEDAEDAFERGRREGYKQGFEQGAIQADDYEKGFRRGFTAGAYYGFYRWRFPTDPARNYIAAAGIFLFAETSAFARDVWRREQEKPHGTKLEDYQAYLSPARLLEMPVTLREIPLAASGGGRLYKEEE